MGNHKSEGTYLEDFSILPPNANVLQRQRLGRLSLQARVACFACDIYEYSMETRVQHSTCT